ncbi:MAG: pyridoxal phosphate-dependent decarboxylase family protein [Acidimicrobiales bacterium]
MPAGPSDHHRLPRLGSDADQVLARMAALRTDDRDWRGGRVFSLVYSAGEDVHDLLERAATLFSAENALNTGVFPSLARMSQDIVSITTGLLGADRLLDEDRGAVRGYLTSGGTESLLQAVRTARDWGRSERAIVRPNMVLAASAHAAFEKAAHYFDVESRRVPVRSDFTADPDAMADAADDHTVMVVGSAPTYPQGIIDPVTELAAVADDRGILCHVDACLGGFILPFLERLGHVRTPWDLSVPGVTSISADLHKYGYGSKGVSVIVYRTRQLARLQPFVTSNWLGGLYGSPAMAGTRPAGPIAAGWAVLHHLGEDGYVRLAEASYRAATALIGAIEETPGLALRGRPDATVLAFGTDPDDPGLDTFALGDALAERGGWFFDRQTPPDSLHATVHAGHGSVIEALRADLGAASAELRATGTRTADRSTTYGTS